MSENNSVVKRKRARTLDSMRQSRRIRAPYVDNTLNENGIMQGALVEESGSVYDEDMGVKDGSYVGSLVESAGGTTVGSAVGSAVGQIDYVPVDGSALEFVNNMNYTSTKKVKKQRTVSLPQLPHARLMYTSKVDDKRGQNYDELLHVSGSTTQTVDGNKVIKLPLIRSVSPVRIEGRGARRLGTGGNGMETQAGVKSPSRLAKIWRRPSLQGHNNEGGDRTGHTGSINLTGNGRNEERFATDNEGHYIYKFNDIFANNRFQTLELLGQGTFGKVVKCRDFKDQKNVAVKIIRAVDRYRQAAKTELRVLKAIKDNDPRGHYQCLLLREYFDYKNHICLVTDLYGKSVYDFMTSNGYARFPGSHVQAIGKQLVRSVCFLHDLGIIHTDLKPENILICDETCVEEPLPKEILNMITERRRRASGGKRKILIDPEVKLIDFGSAVFYNEYHPPVVSTRHYRAPEIVLGLGWSFPCDVWSIACVLVELVTGESLYPIHENLEHMAMMQRINNENLPKKMVDTMFYKVENSYGAIPSDLQATVVKHFDKASGKLQWPNKEFQGNTSMKDRSWKRVMSSCDRLDTFISKKLQMDYGSWLDINWDLTLDENLGILASKSYGSYLDKNVVTFWYLFLDLCRKMFHFDPTRRITAKEAMEHEWFSVGILDEGISHYGRF